MFRRKTKLTMQQMLAARPVRLIESEPLSAGEGKWKLTVPLKPARWASLLLRMPSGAAKTFELDELGHFVLGSCDGRTSVQQIIHRLAKRYNLNVREAQVSTLAFLNTLARKGLVGMMVQTKRHEGTKALRHEGKQRET